MTDTDLETASAETVPTSVEPAPVSVDEQTAVEELPGKFEFVETASPVVPINATRNILDGFSQQIAPDSEHQDFITYAKAELHKIEQFILTHVVTPIDAGL